MLGVLILDGAGALIRTTMDEKDVAKYSSPVAQRRQRTLARTPTRTPTLTLTLTLTLNLTVALALALTLAPARRAASPT